MAKKNKPIFSLRNLKKTSITTLIALFVFLMTQMAPHVTTNAPVQLPGSNSPVQLYSNQTQDDLLQLYLSAIKSAKQTITFVIYSILDPQIIQALKEKNEAGVCVYIVCDAKASPGIGRKIPSAEIVKRIGKGLMHQKILIIDEKQILVGSANMTTDSLKTHGNLVIGIDNPSLAQALTAKAKSMDEEGNSTPLTHRQTTFGPQNLELSVLPDDPKAVKRMIDLFRSAKKTIRVAMFTWTRQDFAEELVQAAKRGVKVEVAVDRYSGKGASAKIVSFLSRSGIPVYLSTGKGLLHHKFVYIDEEILENGSANWTNSAFKINDDYFVVLYPLTPEQRAKMNQLWSVIIEQGERVR